MKKTTIILSTLALLSICACKQTPNITAVLENPESRTELFNTITKDHKMMSEFMETIKGETHAMMMMQGDTTMKEMMLNNHNMMEMMKTNPEMMNQMMSEMTKDGHMMTNMTQIMHKQGMMSEDCMQSCLKNLRKAKEMTKE